MPSNGQQPSFSSETYREDIVFLRDVFPSIDRSFTDSSLGRFHARLATLLDQLGELTFASFAMGVAHCLAAADNAHTMPVLRYRLRVVPLRVHWFSDGLYAIRSLAGPADLVGACLVGIDGKSPEYWLGGLKEYIGGNSARHRAMSTFFLVCPGALASIDPSASADRLTFTYRGKSGVESECTLEIAALERNIEIFPRRDPGIAFLDAAGTGWRQALDGISVVPLYLRDSGKSAFHEWLPELRAMFIRIRSTTDDHDFSLSDYFDKVIGQVRSVEARNAIVDLRFNDGGDYLLGRTFCQELPAALHPGGRLFIITNNFTFSAGLVLAALLKFHGGERASIVGETPGDRPSFWAEGGVFDLPGTRLPVRCATHYHNWEVGSRDPLASPWFNVLYNVPAGSLDPAPCVETAFGDYASGRDPVMGLIGQWLRE